MNDNHDYHNKHGLIAFIGANTFVFLFLFYLVFINKGVTLDENVRDPLPANAPKFELASIKEPWLDNAEVAAAGEKIYAQNCAVCHGAKGDLVGGIPNARNLVEGKWTQGEGMIAHYKVLQNGIAGTQMAAFKQSLKPNERWAIINYINSFTKNKSTDKAEDIAAFAQSAD